MKHFLTTLFGLTGSSIPAAQQPLAIRFRAMFGAEELSGGGSYAGVGVTTRRAAAPPAATPRPRYTPHQEVVQVFADGVVSLYHDDIPP
jgi:hypothetical protein